MFRSTDAWFEQIRPILFSFHLVPEGDGETRGCGENGVNRVNRTFGETGKNLKLELSRQDYTHISKGDEHTQEQEWSQHPVLVCFRVKEQGTSTLFVRFVFSSAAGS